MGVPVEQDPNLSTGWGAEDGKNTLNSASQQRGGTKPGHAADFIDSIGH